MYFNKPEHSGIISISVTDPEVNIYKELSGRKKAKEKVALWLMKLALQCVNGKTCLSHSHGIQHLLLLILLVNVLI